MIKKWVHAIGAVTGTALVVLPALLPVLPVHWCAAAGTLIAYLTNVRKILPVSDRLELPPNMNKLPP